MLLNHVEDSDAPFSSELLQSIDRAYSLTSSNNSEVKFRWQSLCLHSDCDWIVPHVVNFITSQGRMKFVRPLYRLLRSSSVGAETAVQTFAANSESYHPIARKMVASDLQKAAALEVFVLVLLLDSIM